MSVDGNRIPIPPSLPVCVQPEIFEPRKGQRVWFMEPHGGGGFGRVISINYLAPGSSPTYLVEWEDTWAYGPGGSRRREWYHQNELRPDAVHRLKDKFHAD